MSNEKPDILDRINANFRGTAMYEGRKPTLLEEAAQVIAEERDRATRAEAEVERLKELCRAEIQNRQQSDRAFLESDQKRHDAEAEAAEYKARYEAEVEHSNAVTRKDPEAALAAADALAEAVQSEDPNRRGEPRPDWWVRLARALAAYRAARNGEEG